MMNAVGGTTLHYWAQSWRLNPWDFKVVSETTRRYGASRIPKGSTVEDWPFGLDELEPYYDKVEYEIGVSGQAGNINGTHRSARQHRSKARASARTRCRRCADRRSPTRWRPPRSRSAGIRSRARRRSTRERTRTAPAACITASATRGGCHVDAKNSTAVTTIPRAQATGHFKVVTGAHRHDDRSRRARAARRGVTYVTDGEEFFQPAKVVLLASYTYENSGCCCCRSRRRFRTACRTITARSAGTTSATTRARRRHGAVSVRTSTPGTACRRRASPSTTGPTTTSITPALDFIGGGNLWVDVGSAADRRRRR